MWRTEFVQLAWQLDTEFYHHSKPQVVKRSNMVWRSSGLCPQSNSVLTHHFLTATNTLLNEWLNDTTVTNSYEAAAKNDITDGLTKIQIQNMDLMSSCGSSYVKIFQVL